MTSTGHPGGGNDLHSIEGGAGSGCPEGGPPSGDPAAGGRMQPEGGHLLVETLRVDVDDLLHLHQLARRRSGCQERQEVNLAHLEAMLA